jgi:hypothetical protein
VTTKKTTKKKQPRKNKPDRSLWNSPENMKSRLEKQKKLLDDMGIVVPVKIPGSSNYDQQYDLMLIEHMACGYTFETFGALVNKSCQKLYDWKKLYPSFAEAHEIGKVYNKMFWEKVGMAGMLGQIPNFQSNIWGFNMKNRFGWRDSVKDEIGAKPVPIVINLPKEKETIKVDTTETIDVAGKT